MPDMVFVKQRSSLLQLLDDASSTTAALAIFC